MVIGIIAFLSVIVMMAAKAALVKEQY